LGSKSPTRNLLSSEIPLKPILQPCQHTLSTRKETSGCAATPTLIFKLSNANEINTPKNLETEETYQ